MTDRTQPDSASTTGATHIIRYALEMGLLWIDGDGRDKVREALDALDTLEAQPEAIGAGGVNGPLIGQPQAMPDLSALTERGAKAWAGVDAQALREGRWYMVNKDGMATLCADEADAQREAADAQAIWPGMGPHSAVQLVDAGRASLQSPGFSAEDMATASAQGFRDGVASVAASAPTPSAHIKEPYTLAEIKAKIASNDYGAELLLQHAMALLDSASLAASAGSEPVAWREHVEQRLLTWRQRFVNRCGDQLALDDFMDKQSLDDLIDFVCDEWAPLTHPSPPEGMVGGWMPIETAPRDGKFLVRDGTWHGKVASTPKLSDVAMVERSDGGAFEVSDTDYYTAYITNPTGWMPLPPTASAGSGKGE